MKLSQWAAFCASVCFSFNGITTHAGGAVARLEREREQVIQQRQQLQQQAVLQAQQQALHARQQAVQQAVHQKAVQERQAALRMAQQRAVEERIAAQRIARQRAVQERTALQKRAQQAAIQQTISTSAILQSQAVKQYALNEAVEQMAQEQQETARVQGAQLSRMNQRVMQEKSRDASMRYYERTQAEVEDVVDIEQIWEELQISSEVWPLIIDLEPKAAVISRYIELYQEKGIVIRKDPSHYVQMIDDITQSNPALLNEPFMNVLKLAAIIEYDFDNGQDKDQLAERVLGEKMYQDNKKRLGL